jgi:hypothetical protein
LGEWSTDGTGIGYRLAYFTRSYFILPCDLLDNETCHFKTFLLTALVMVDMKTLLKAYVVLIIIIIIIIIIRTKLIRGLCWLLYTRGLQRMARGALCSGPPAILKK